MTEITEKMLDELREKVMALLSPKRFCHTVGVERMTERLCSLFCPAETLPMRAAAILHDITKERTPEEQVGLCRQYGIVLTPEDLNAPKTLHGRTAAAMIPAEFPEFAQETVISAVRWHTTGRADMTLTEKILYLADYIDESRTFPNCVLLRRYFFGADPERLSPEEREKLLTDTLILSYDMTIRDLLEEGKSIAEDTVRARNELILGRNTRNV